MTLFIHNVTIKIEADTHESFGEWMLKEHMPDVMATRLFSDYRVGRLLDTDEIEGRPMWSKTRFPAGMNTIDTSMNLHGYFRKNYQNAGSSIS